MIYGAPGVTRTRDLLIRSQRHFCPHSLDIVKLIKLSADMQYAISISILQYR